MLSKEEHYGPLVNRNDHAWAAGLWVSGSPLANAARRVAARRELCGRLQLRDAREMRPASLVLIIVMAAIIPFLAASGMLAAEPKRVLMIHSFAIAAPPFTVVATAFEAELAAKMGERVDVDEVSLDMARYADGDMQEAMVDYLQKRQGRWRPELVVPIGSPANIFVATYRDRLFQETPILYTVGRPLLPPGAPGKNATYIGQEFDLPGFVQDILQLAPATKNIEVIVGATPLEHRWQENFEKAVEPFKNRLKFTYYNDFAFDQMKARVSTLPPDSYIFFLLLLRDAAGVTLNADDALQRLHAVANAPINSMFERQIQLVHRWVGFAPATSRGPEGKLRISPFAFYVASHRPVCLPKSSSVRRRVMIHASWSDGRSMPACWRVTAPSYFARRRLGNATGAGSCPGFRSSFCRRC